MIESLQRVLWQAGQRLTEQVLPPLPNVLATLVVLAIGWLVARLTERAVERMSAGWQKTLEPWGLCDHWGHTSTTHVLARGVFWLLFSGAILLGISLLDTQLGSRLVAGAVSYLPRLASAGLILLAGLMLGRFLARGALIWAVNEGIGPARWIAAGVRVGVGLLTMVAVTEQLALARAAMLTTFVILLGGAVLAASLAIGLGSRKRVEQWLDRRAAFLEEERREADLLEHL